MISESHKFIIITPPKTGSTSLVEALKGYIKIYDIKPQLGGATFDYSEVSGGQKVNHKHKKAQRYKNEILSNKYMVFCSTRNPFERMVSWWLFYNKRKKEKKSFERFLLNSREGRFTRFTNIVDYCSIGSEMCVNNFIRLENLQQDFNLACDKIGIPRRQLPHMNKGNHKHYAEYYDDETREIVAEKYAKDIEYFGYKFGE